MTFNNHQISPPFDKYIEAIFHFKDFMPDHSIERVVPTGHIFLIFELDGFPRYTFDRENLQPNQAFTKAWISGMHRNFISISAHEKSEMFIIQFKAHGLYPFLHSPINELTEKVIAAKAIFGQSILDLRTKLLISKTSKEKFSLAEKWLTNKFNATQIPPKELLDTIIQLQKEPAHNFAEIIASYPHSQKHLINQFKKYVGLTPKYYQRILRFNEILQKVQQKENISWTQIAYSCDFSDQSHFIKEFKHFSGFNPQEFIHQDFKQEESNFFPLDRPD